MARKKKTGRAGDAGVAAQHPDSKGINPARDANRGAGQAAITVAKGGGTSGFRKRRKAGD